jgi:hypothetical protein
VFLEKQALNSLVLSKAKGGSQPEETSTTALALTRTALMEPETGSTIPHQKTGPSGRNEL